MSHRVPPTIGVLSELAFDYRGTGYWSRILAGVRGSVQQQQARLLVVMVPWGWVQHANRPLAEDHVDGWITILGTRELLQHRQTGHPIVTVGAHYADLGVPAVLSDNHAAIRAAMVHLFDHGHERIGFVGSRDLFDFQQRFDAYKAMLAEHGLSFDPQLVYETGDARIRTAQPAIHALLAQPLQCTALVCCTSGHARDIVVAVQRAGIRVPEDLAIIGLGNDTDDQYLDPPLTTVDLHFDVLGRIAAEHLFLHISGGTPPPVTYTPITLVVRRSCGCQHVASIDTAIRLEQPDYWGIHLAQQRVAHIQAQGAPKQVSSLTTLWPGWATLTDGFSAAIHDRPLPSVQAVSEAWRQLVTLTSDIEQVNGVRRSLEQAASQLLTQQGGGPAAAASLETFLDYSHLELIRAQTRLFRDETAWLVELLDTTRRVSEALLTGTSQKIHDLAWVHQVGATWACLGLWTNQKNHPPTELVITATYGQQPGTLPQHGHHYHLSNFPLPLDGEDGNDSQSSLTTVLFPVTTNTRYWGVLAMRIPEQIPSFALGLWTSLLGHALEREELLRLVNKLMLAQEDKPSTHVISRHGLVAQQSHTQHTNTIELRLIESGSVTYLVGGRRIVLVAGRMAICWTSSPQQIVVVEPGTTCYRIVIALGWLLKRFIPDALLQPILHGELVIDQAAESASDLALFAQWHTDLQNNPVEYGEIILLEIEARLRRLAQQFAGQVATMQKQVVPTHQHKAEQMAQYIAEHYTESITKEDVGRAVGLHPNYAISLFRRTFRISPTVYITQYRVAHAQRLLLTTTASIAEIALEAGFGSLSQFYTAFKRYSGRPPRTFARSTPEAG